jgi:hypothetical protein
MLNIDKMLKGASPLKLNKVNAARLKSKNK